MRYQRQKGKRRAGDLGLNPERKRNLHLRDWRRDGNVQRTEQQFPEGEEETRGVQVRGGRDQSIQGGECDQEGLSQGEVTPCEAEKQVYRAHAFI